MYIYIYVSCNWLFKDNPTEVIHDQVIKEQEQKQTVETKLFKETH